MVTYGDLREWDAAGVGSAGARLRTELKVQEGACDERATMAVPDSWVGLASGVAQWRRSALDGQMARHVEGVTSFERAVYDAQGQVSTITTAVDGIDDTPASRSSRSTAVAR